MLYKLKLEKIDNKENYMGDKLNHRRKCKKERKYEELDISKFDDIIKKPNKPKYKDGKKYKGKKGKGNYKPKDKQGYKQQQKEQQKQQNKKPVRN